MSEPPGEGLVPRVGRVADFLGHWASRNPGAPLDELDGTGRAPRSYRRAAGDVARCAAALRASGVRHGDRVAVLTTPRPEFLTLFLALSRVGAVWVGLDPRYTRDELLHVVTDSAPVLLVSLAEHGGRSYGEDMAALRDTAGSVRETVALTGSFPGAVPFEDFLARADEPSGEDERPGEGATSGDGGNDGPGLIIYTSGTTGRPKGAVISHRAFAEGCRLQATRLYHSPAVALANLPVSHVGGVMDVVSVPLAMGGAVCFMEDFDPAAIPAAVERARITLWGQIPTMFQLVMARPEVAEADLSSLVYVAWGGAPLPRELVAPLRATGARLTSVYGLTESCVAVAYNDPDADDETLATTIGRPDPRLELRLAGESGSPVPPGTPGEIQVRNPCLMSGYLGSPDATAAAFTPDGFLRTGDLAVERPDGTLTLVGRLKEMFKSGGYNIYPREIEMALEAHPDVVAAAVVAVPDPVFHEVGAAFAVTRPGAEAGPDDLAGHCRTRLAGHKVPKHFEIVEGLPLLLTGKVDRAALRQAHLSRLSRP
ncbi:class I adenylate-forming enzyme family protein [Actinomadura sp. 3N407]|uniref:class I adenylate-forming enzyme family protein n=1 Tax=Actinomadura sp. 3N407 TaxID=3457423 RepID=UPI003FCCE9B5